MEAMGSYMTNKYSEGYPHARYYGGNEYTDTVEDLARDRLKELFGAEHANVQPHSGTQANMAVYLAFLQPGDTVLGMNLAHGGHLTHGCKVNASGKLYNFVEYGVDKETGTIDYDEVEKIALEHKPKLIVAGATAYPRIFDFKRFKEIADKVDAIFVMDIAHIAGLIAAGLHPNPVPYADVVTTTTHKTLRGPRGGAILCKQEFAKKVDKAMFPGSQGGPLMHVIAAKAVCFKEAATPEFKIYQEQVIRNAKVLAEEMVKLGFDLVSGGTDTHLILVDLSNKGITGKELQERLDTVRITLNKNMVPFDTKKPMVTSGIRIGTPAVTTRGFKEEDMKEIATLLDMTVNSYEDKKDEIISRVDAICAKYPLY